MHVIQDAFRASDLPRGGIATIGNYDGIHRGQRAVIDRVVARARQRDLPALLITFDPHPLTVLRPESAPCLLTTAEQKMKLLAEAGIDFLLHLAFSPEMARVTAEDFVLGFLVGKLSVREIHVGAGFVFGHARGGDLALLADLGAAHGFVAEGVDEVVVGGKPVSSTRIRGALLEGRIEEANAMLGRSYSLIGRVARGDRMGQRIGWPTLNLDPDNELVPADGVYAGRVHLPSLPATFDCATNVGTRPTVYENFERVVESHVLDFSADVYNERIELQFEKRLREERIFPTIMDLSAQIRRDVEATREYFSARRLLAASEGVEETEAEVEGDLL